MSENKKTVPPQDLEQTRPVLKLVYDADKKEVSTPARNPSRLSQLLNAYADSIEKDIRTIMEF